jgi:hypothetical protein
MGLGMRHDDTYIADYIAMFHDKNNQPITIEVQKLQPMDQGAFDDMFPNHAGKKNPHFTLISPNLTRDGLERTSYEMNKTTNGSSLDFTKLPSALEKLGKIEKKLKENLGNHAIATHFDNQLNFLFVASIGKDDTASNKAAIKAIKEVEREEQLASTSPAYKGPVSDWVERHAADVSLTKRVQQAVFDATDGYAVEKEGSANPSSELIKAVTDAVLKAIALKTQSR